MKFSIVIASYLGSYVGAAHNREQKLARAIASAQNQSFKDFEIIVVADGCEKTMELVKDAFNVRSFLIPRGKLFGGGPRNKGIEEAKGDYIVYLDIDDIYGLNHLEKISNHLVSYDWVWYNDLRWDGKWHENPCDINQIGKHGTSNICHKKLGVKWDVRGYAHDYYFVQKLLKFKNYKKIPTPEYYVAHVPGTGRHGGYDV
jgi:glycosyltransferase involved in cell wall biosynthesis